MKTHRLAAPMLALGLGAIAILATAGGSFAAAPGVASAVGPATAACGTVPLDVEIIVDSSGSMGSNYSGSPSNTRLYWAQKAATQLVGQLDANGGGGGHEKISPASPVPDSWVSRGGRGRVNWTRCQLQNDPVKRGEW